MAAFIVGAPRSRLVGVARGSPIIGRLCQAARQAPSGALPD